MLAGESISYQWILNVKGRVMWSLDVLLLLTWTNCWTNVWVASDFRCNDTPVELLKCSLNMVMAVAKICLHTFITDPMLARESISYQWIPLVKGQVMRSLDVFVVVDLNKLLKWKKDPKWCWYWYILLQTRTCIMMINQYNSVFCPQLIRKCRVVGVLTVLLLSPTR